MTTGPATRQVRSLSRPTRKPGALESPGESVVGVSERERPQQGLAALLREQVHRQEQERDLGQHPLPG